MGVDVISPIRLVAKEFIIEWLRVWLGGASFFILTDGLLTTLMGLGVPLLVAFPLERPNFRPSPLIILGDAIA